MSLTDLLSERAIRKALIVDDALDPVPLASDLAGIDREWSVFSDDLNKELRGRLDSIVPGLRDADLQIKIRDNAFVAAVWGMREELGGIATPLFETYISNQQADLRYVDLAQRTLERLDITCSRAGRSFENEVQEVDLVIIDLYLGTSQNGEAYDLSKTLLRAAIARRIKNPPLVILVSRSSYLSSKRDEFRDDTGLLESGFRILSKSDLEVEGRLERQLERLAQNATDTRKLAKFISSLESGMKGAAERTLTAMRRLKISDIGQVQQLLLQFEGEPVGSYLVDLFDRLLQHEVEADDDIISSARALNDFKTAQHQAPYVAGSPELQDLVYRTLSQNSKRLTLRSSPEYPLAFGDILTVAAAPTASSEGRPDKGTSLPVEVGVDSVLLVLTPACDLQRGKAKRVLLLVGQKKPVSRAGWTYGSGARTPSISIDDQLVTIEWDLDHIDTIDWPKLRSGLDRGEVSVVARLREAHALELQQKLLSGLGRVGVVAAMPASFPVSISAYVPDFEGRPRPTEVPEFSDGAVVFVGRDKGGNRVLKLVLTEAGCDGLDDALRNLDDAKVAPDTLKSLQHIRNTDELSRLLSDGLDLTKMQEGKWLDLSAPSSTSLSHMARVGWNLDVPPTPLGKNLLQKSGVMLLISDADAMKAAPGLSDLVRTGDVQSYSVEADSAAIGDPAVPADKNKDLAE